MTAIGLGLLVIMGAAWLSSHLTFGSAVTQTYVKAGTVAAVLIICGLVGYHYIGRKPGVVEFFIATEAEMKKVNWSSRREISGSTWVVIGMTVVIGILTGLFDNAFAWFFMQIGVLQGGS